MKKFKLKFFAFFNSLNLFAYIIIFGLFFAAAIIRFFIPRLPKDVPFSLNEFYFYIFGGISISYLYAFYRSIYPKDPPQIVLNILFAIAKAFTFIQNKIYFHPKIYSTYYKVLYEILIIKFFYLSYENKERLFIFCKYFPRIFLLFILLSDIFIFNEIKIFYYSLPIYLISFLFSYFVATIKRGKESLIQKLENRYKGVEINEKGNSKPMFVWDEIIENFGKEKFEKLTFKEKCDVLTYYEYEPYSEEEKDIIRSRIIEEYNSDEDTYYDLDHNFFPEKRIQIKHNPNAIYHCTVGSNNVINTYKASVRNCLDILFERCINHDENDPENDYLYEASPCGHDHIYINYKKTKSIEKLDVEDYDEIKKEFHEIVEILIPVVYSVLDTLQAFENRKRFKKISAYSFLGLALCWFFFLGISYYVFPCDFELTLYIINILLKSYPKEDPYSLLDILDNPILNIAWTDVWYILSYMKYQGLLPIKMFISYIIFKFFIKIKLEKSKTHKRRRRRIYGGKLVKNDKKV